MQLYIKVGILQTNKESVLLYMVEQGDRFC